MTATSIPAASLIIFRDAASAPELLMLERSRTLAFAPGAWVWPGGRIDPGDTALARRLGLDEDGPARIAAIRETIEEAGVAIGITGLTITNLAVVRQRLHDGTALSDALDGHTAWIDPGVLVPFARWTPQHRSDRNFDTRFYLARLPPETPPPTVDGTEHARLRWVAANTLLDEADRGVAHVIFPTRRNLERLARFASYADAAADAARWPITPIVTYEERRGDTDWILIPDGFGYPVRGEPLSDANRG